MLNSGDTAWVLASAALVMLMTPGLAFFYGGMVRSKGVLNMLMMNYIALAVVSVLWVFYGFSLAFGNDIGGGLLGGFEYVGLNNVADALAGYAVDADPETGRRGSGLARQQRHPAVRVRDVPADVRGDHPGPDLGGDRRSRQVLELDAVRGPLGHPRLLPGGALGVRLRRLRRSRRHRRLDRQHARRARLRRWHGGAHQRRCGRSGAGHRAGQAPRLAAGADAPAQPAVRAARRGAAVVRLVRLQRRLGAGRRRAGRPGLHQHHGRDRGRGAGLAGRRADPRRQADHPGRRLGCGGRPGRHHPRLWVGLAAGRDRDRRDRRCGVRAGRGAEVQVRLRRLARRGRRAPGRRSGRHAADRLLRNRRPACSTAAVPRCWAPRPSRRSP